MTGDVTAAERKVQLDQPAADHPGAPDTPPQDTSSQHALHDAAIHAPSHPVVVANPEHRARTESIPASRIGELPGPSGSADIHGRTLGLPFRDGDPDPEGWYSGQGGITGDGSQDMVPVSDDAREAKEKRHERLAGR